MEIKVRLSNLRTAPRKVRQVADLIRGKKAGQAQTILSFTTNKPAVSILKLLNSAIATAKNDLHIDDSNLFVSKITVDEGPKLKRSHPMSRGRAYPIMKRTSHIVLHLNELVPVVKEGNDPKKEQKKEEVKNQIKKVKVVKEKKAKKEKE